MEKELSRLNFKADIYENELEELYEEGYACAEKVLTPYLKV